MKDPSVKVGARYRHLPFRLQRIARTGSLPIRGVLVAFLLLVSVTGMPAKTARRTDAMGAHLNFGRGCPACHCPHSQGAVNSDATTAPARSSTNMLWGGNVTGTYARYGDDLASRPDRSSNRGMLVCLTCHDGNYAPRAMMRNVAYEPIPADFGIGYTVPTVVDKDDLNAGNDIDDHPMGLAAQVKCGGAFGWDCTQTREGIRMQGAFSSKFAANYGYFVKPAHSGDTSLLVCSSCHNPHSMTWTAVTTKTASNLYPPGTYPTKHFLRAPEYDVAVGSPGDNRKAQFCRQCHADKSNEMNGSLATGE